MASCEGLLAPVAGRVRWALALVLLLDGCAVRVGPGPQEPPLFRRIDARIGVAYTQAARNARISALLMRFDVGKASIPRLNQVFASMFTHVSELPDRPPWREAAPDVDGVIEVERIDPSLDIGNDAGGPYFGGAAKADVVSVSYRVCLYTGPATLIECWTPSGSDIHQRTMWECLDLWRCVARMIEAAMREAIARFMVEAEHSPQLQALSQQHSGGGQP